MLPLRTFYNKCCYFNITGIVILRNIDRVFQASEKQSWNPNIQCWYVTFVSQILKSREVTKHVWCTADWRPIIFHDINIDDTKIYQQILLLKPLNPRLQIIKVGNFGCRLTNARWHIHYWYRWTMNSLILKAIYFTYIVRYIHFTAENNITPTVINICAPSVGFILGHAILKHI